MRKIILVAFVASLLAASAQAADFTDTAKVISSRPIFQQITSQECHLATSTIAGYEVRYSYMGREGVSTMLHQPGDTMHVGVTAY